METKGTFKPIPNASRYEIDSRGAIRRVKDKSPIFTDNNKVRIYFDDGKQASACTVDLVKELFNRTIPAGKNERDNSEINSPEKIAERAAKEKAKNESFKAAEQAISERSERGKKMTMPSGIVTKEEKKAEKAKANVAPPRTAETDAKIKTIASLTCKKYQRIWLLYSAGVEKSEIMKIASANAGEVGNAIKAVEVSKEKQDAANALLA